MRFLHLADLHLGKSLYGVSLIDNKDQEYWKDRFLEKTEEIKPDAVVISGDIYDRNAPSGQAVMLLDSMLTRLESMGIPVLIIAGNHDSGQKLSFGGSILAKQNIYVAGVADIEIRRVTIPEKDGLGDVTFWLIPYLFPAMAAKLFEDESIRDYETAMRRLLESQNIDFSRRNVAVAHQNVTAQGKEARRGGSESMAGGVGQMDYRVFDGFDYVALGHIHASYHVGRRQVRYAGTPLCYHFDETRQPQKGPLLVELGEKGTPVTIETVAIPPLHPMREIRGTYEEIKSREETNRSTGEYVRIVITDRRVTPEISRFFRELLGKRDSLVMELVSDLRETGTRGQGVSAGPQKEKSIEEYFADLYRERKGQKEPEEKDLELFRFAAQRTGSRQQWENGRENMERDVNDLLEFILRQEGGQ